MNFQELMEWETVYVGEDVIVQWNNSVTFRVMIISTNTYMGDEGFATEMDVFTAGTSGLGRHDDAHSWARDMAERWVETNSDALMTELDECPDTEPEHEPF